MAADSRVDRDRVTPGRRGSVSASNNCNGSLSGVANCCVLSRHIPASRARASRQPRGEPAIPARDVCRTSAAWRARCEDYRGRLVRKPILIADSIGKSFKGRRILSSATLRAVPGELRVLFGQNGAGKSTLMKIACGVISPDGGTVHFRERAYLSANLPALAAAGLF